MCAPSRCDEVGSQMSVPQHAPSPEVGVAKSVRRPGVELLHVGRLHVAPPARNRVRPHERDELPQRETQPLRHVLEVGHGLGRCTAQETGLTAMPRLWRGSGGAASLRTAGAT